MILTICMLLTIAADIVTRILRHHFGDAWPIGTIAKQLGVHRDTIKRVLLRAGVAIKLKVTHPSKIDPFVPFMLETLTKYPNLRAKRLHGMVCERGYDGGPDHFRHVVARMRPRKPAEAFMRLRMLPGEQAQVDWAHFGTLPVIGGSRKLYAFVMVLSYSRRIFLRFGFDIGMAGFLRGHAEAFAYFEGVPRVVLYDNLKSAVIERQGDVVRFNEELLALSAFYRYEARPVAVARGNEKGRVERTIQNIRHGFFAGREVKNLAQLNAEADTWTILDAETRLCPEDRTCKVGVAFAEEKLLLRQLPADTYPCDERKEVSVGKTPYVRFDTNDYSAPHDCVRRQLVVVASLSSVRIFEGQRLVAEHPRSFGVHQQIDDAAHIAKLKEHKAFAATHSAQDWLVRAVPESKELLVRLAARQGSTGTAVAQLARLLQSYGHAEFRVAVVEVLADTGSHPNSVRHVLEKRRAAQGKAQINEQLLDNIADLKHVDVVPHNLADYDDDDTVSTQPAKSAFTAAKEPQNDK